MQHVKCSRVIEGEKIETLKEMKRRRRHSSIEVNADCAQRSAGSRLGSDAVVIRSMRQFMSEMSLKGLCERLGYCLLALRDVVEPVRCEVLWRESCDWDVPGVGVPSVCVLLSLVNK